MEEGTDRAEEAADRPAKWPGGPSARSAASRACAHAGRPAAARAIKATNQASRQCAHAGRLAAQP